MWLKPALALIPLGFALKASIVVQARVIDQLPTEVLECAETLRQLKHPGDRLIARKWHVAFHAGVEGLPFPFADSLAALAQYAHANHVRWLYFSWPEAETRPKFYHLLDTSGVVPGLTPRRVTQPHPAVLYEIGPEFGRTPSWYANDTLKALHMLQARLMVEGDNPKVLMAYSQVAYTQGNHGHAHAALMRAVSYAPRDPDVLMTASGIALDAQDAPTALVLLRRAAEIAPRNAYIQVGLGLAQLTTGDATAAAATWRPVIEACTDPPILLNMVKLYHVNGDREAEQRAMARLRQIGGMP